MAVQTLALRELMKTALKLVGLFSLLLLVTGFSYSLALDGEIAVSGDIGLGLEALKKAVLDSGGELVHSRDGKAHWYALRGVSLTLEPNNTGNSIQVKASIFMGSGCTGREKAKERATELLGHIVGRASQQSGIPMTLKSEQGSNPPAR